MRTERSRWAMSSSVRPRPRVRRNAGSGRWRARWRSSPRTGRCTCWVSRTRRPRDTAKWRGSGRPRRRRASPADTGETLAPRRRYSVLMRGIAVAVVVCVLLGTLGRAAASSTADLVIQVDGLVKAFPGDTGIYIADPLSPQPLYAHDAAGVVIAASLYKLGILAHIEHLVDAGTL